MERLYLQISPNGQITRASSTASDLLGQSAESIVGKTLKELFPSLELQSVAPHSPRAMSWDTVGWIDGERDGAPLEIRRIGLAGGDSLIEIQSNPILPPGESEQFLTNVLADSADAIICLDLEDRVTVWNRGAEVLYGYKREEILGQNVELLVPPEYVKELRVLRQRVKREGHVTNHPTIRRRRDGQEIHVTITRTALRDPEGRMIGTSVIVRDVTEAVQATRHLQHSEKMAAIGQLAAGIAHELGTPLGVISGTAEFLEGEIDGDAEMLEGLRTIRRQAQACTRLLRDLMDYARRPTFEVSGVDINTCMRDTLRLVQRLFERDKIRTETDLATGLPPIQGDANQLEQVFMNMFINAWQAMPGGGLLRVASHPTPGKDGVVVEISDTGMGIAPEHLPHIFNPFFTTKSAGGGTGLGLAVCDQIIEAHGGTIEATSTPGHGTSFLIAFPMRSGARPEPLEMMER
jgi:two-component system NtrC family sensor kinase